MRKYFRADKGFGPNKGKIPNLVLFLNPDALISFHNPNYKSENWNRQSPSTVKKKTKGCKQRNPYIHAWKKLLTSWSIKSDS